MNAPASISITPVRVADLLAEGERMPVYVYVINHPDARARFEPDRGNLSSVGWSGARDLNPGPHGPEPA